MRSIRFLPTIVLLSFGILAGACSLHRPIKYDCGSDYTVADPQFAQSIGNILGPPLVGGNNCTTLINGDQYFPAMLEAIKAAKVSITLETYIFWKGNIAHEFALAIAERAKAGVKAHVLIDWHGSSKIDKNDYQLMKDAGVQVEKFHVFQPLDIYSYGELDSRTHRKILVVDGKIGFTGGAGMADEWAGNAQDKKHWRDTHYKLEGPAVAQLQATFAENWINTTGCVLDGKEYFPPLEPAGSQFVQVSKSDSMGGANSMHLLVLLSLAHAGKTIRIESAYFLPDKQVIRALCDACKRGVKVEVIVPGRHMDVPIVRSATRSAWRSLLTAGVEIYEYQPTMMHCKLLVVDDLWSSIGSANMDNRSFRINAEANLNVLDRDFAAVQTQMFEIDKAKSKRITLEAWKNRPLWQQLTEPFANMVGREL